ncbi:VgrG-related protein [Solirubrobacter phytolaccae]|uniref:VgrG-related protein n=1 Tax=Solirubrobacter phytolaccae TaxID=1404360 RepID=A0A9X3NIK9_9ACTN|nr:VgrG-related protein [Solirubrobacter phytolaccae]MDA0185595.1 VgrG-related protein [Solirubrobacter phytolaccae]
MPAVNGTTSKEHVASLQVFIGGAELDPKYRDLLTEVKVVDSLTLPDMALVRITDQKGENIDANPLQLGAKIEIKAGQMSDRSSTSIFKGQIAAVEPEFTPKGVVLSARAYDEAHKLNREKKSRTFQQMSASNMAQKVAAESGLPVGEIKSTSVVHEFFQQSNETDWAFLWRLAMMHDYEVVVADGKFNFRPANVAGGAATEIRWGDTLQTFRPRMSGIQQVNEVEVRAWDPKTKQVVNGRASSPTTTSQPGVARSKVAGDIGGGKTVVTDRPAATTAEANEIAKSTLQRMADAFFEADGVARGNPAIKAGGKLKIAGVGEKFGGEFTVSSSTHSYHGHRGYQTSFQISGRSSRTLTELVRAPQEKSWTASIVVGVVTNNNDPEQRGRVRVKYPSLSDKEESAWAPVATPSSGNQRGLLMLPQPDEEVVIGFEHGDSRRPIVLGSTFNGKDKPGEELLQNRDGSFGLVSNEKIHQHSKKDFEITSDQNMVVEIKQDEKVKVTGNSTHETTGNNKQKAQTFVVEAGSSMTVKGVSVTVEASAALTLKGATVDIQSSSALTLKGAIINIG